MEKNTSDGTIRDRFTVLWIVFGILSMIVSLFLLSYQDEKPTKEPEPACDPKTVERLEREMAMMQPMLDALKGQAEAVGEGLEVYMEDRRRLLIVANAFVAADPGTTHLVVCDILSDNDAGSSVSATFVGNSKSWIDARRTPPPVELKANQRLDCVGYPVVYESDGVARVQIIH